MSHGPLVSILMNCYNSDTYLRESIECVYAQTYENWEIIFWDNNSSDKSAEIAQSYDEKLKYFRGETTVPLYAARELAIKKAQGELIAILDCDDLWTPDKLQKQVPLFHNEKVGLVFSDTVFFDETGDLKQLYKTRPYYTGKCFKELLSDYYLSLETVMFRKSCLEAWPYAFDERFNMIGDADLFRRIAYNWELAIVDEPLGKWRVHENSLSQKVPEKFAAETLLLIETYKKLIPDFEKNYVNEIEELKKQSAYIKAKSLWSRGKSSLARKELSHFLGSKKILATYFLTFLPMRLVENVMRFKARHN